MGRDLGLGRRGLRQSVVERSVRIFRPFAAERQIERVRCNGACLDAQGKYHSSFDYTVLEDGVSEDRTLGADGAYSIDGSVVTLRRSDGKDVTEGSIANGQLTIEMTVMGNTEPRSYAVHK